MGWLAKFKGDCFIMVRKDIWIKFRVVVEVKHFFVYLCTHYCLFVSCNLDKWYNIKLMVVESQAVGRRKQAKGAPCPLIPRDSLKTTELFLHCWVLMHSVLWLFVYTPKKVDIWGVHRTRGGQGISNVKYLRQHWRIKKSQTFSLFYEIFFNVYLGNSNQKWV